MSVNIPPELKPITGFKNIDSPFTEAVKSNQQLPVVKDPTVPFDYQQGASRANMLSSIRAISFQDIENGYNVDSYIRQSVCKYVEKIIKEGFKITGPNTACVEYINARLNMMTAASGKYWYSSIVAAIKDCVKFGNGYLVKGRMTKNADVFTMKKKGMKRTGTPESNKPPVGAYYPVSALYITPRFDDDKKLMDWKHTVPGVGETFYAPEDVITMVYDSLAGGLLGSSYLIPALDDVRILRSTEQMIVQLLFKSLNPLIHHEVPDTTKTGYGDQRDVDAAAAEHDVMAVNGYLCTPPGHKIQVLGVESKALRAEGYLKAIKQRVYAGLGLSELIMGEASTSSVGASDSFTAIMNDKVRYFQFEIAACLTYKIIWELLIEGGFDPIFNEQDRVFWEFNEVDIDRRIKVEAHSLLQYQGNTISETEAREAAGRQPVADAERVGFYLNMVQIPLAQLKGQQSTSVSPSKLGPAKGPSTNSTHKIASNLANKVAQKI